MSAPKGHRNLGLRGLTTYMQAGLTMIALCYEINIPINSVMLASQLFAATTLIIQWRTANPKMFLARAVPSFIRCILSFYAAACGRRWPWEECNSAAWYDIRQPLRVLTVYAAIRFFLNGLSLCLQYKFPKRGVGVRGNEQLFYRGLVRFSGVPLHLCRALLKIGELGGTERERQPVEIFINLTNGLIIVPLATWTLLNQWATSGTGRRTDDMRTSEVGSIRKGAPDSFADFVEPHKGDRNLIIRATIEFTQFFFTLWLVCYNIDPFHMALQAIFEIVTSSALIYQWRHDHSSTHKWRALASVMMVFAFLHAGVCGYTLPWETCEVKGWRDARRPTRLMLCLLSLRMLANAVSLVLQYKLPDRGVTAKYGNEQLLFRSLLRFWGIPLYMVLAYQAFNDLNGTEFERPSLEIVINLIRGFVLIPVLTVSLVHQWRYTGTENEARCTPVRRSSLQEQMAKTASAAPPAPSLETATNGVKTTEAEPDLAAAPNGDKPLVSLEATEEKAPQVVISVEKVPGNDSKAQI